MKIASLEDDLAQARRIQQVLSAAGYACTSYHQSRDLLAALRTEVFDLVLLDWHLPDIDGDDVVRWLRTHIGARIPVIFLTNRSSEDDLVEGLRAGADVRLDDRAVSQLHCRVQSDGHGLEVVDLASKNGVFASSIWEATFSAFNSSSTKASYCSLLKGQLR